ncbi:MAG: hypothetical protein M3384_17105, partial [Acidobacteriota bacterium]|nr:hypothetical protein [Acidobacteriota bacterium]
MDKEFKNSVIEDLKKSGFSSELKAIKIFLTSKWNTSAFANYFDVDQQQITGVDLRAWRHQEISSTAAKYR